MQLDSNLLQGLSNLFALGRTLRNESKLEQEVGNLDHKLVDLELGTRASLDAIQEELNNLTQGREEIDESIASLQDQINGVFAGPATEMIQFSDNIGRTLIEYYHLGIFSSIIFWSDYDLTAHAVSPLNRHTIARMFRDHTVAGQEYLPQYKNWNDMAYTFNRQIEVFPAATNLNESLAFTPIGMTDFMKHLSKRHALGLYLLNYEGECMAYKEKYFHNYETTPTYVPSWINNPGFDVGATPEDVFVCVCEVFLMTQYQWTSGHDVLYYSRMPVREFRMQDPEYYATIPHF